MTTQIKVLRETLVNKLSNIKDDNVQIADIVIERRKLLEALKLQTQPDANMLTINYGKVGWHYDYENHSDGTWHYEPHTFEPQPCIQISCNHTIMRFMNHPKVKWGVEPKIIPLNFVDHTEYVKPELSGIPIDTQELLKALTFVQHGIATEDIRPALSCVLFDGNKLVTADGFRLPIAKVKGLPKSKILIHRNDVPKLITFLKSNIEGKGKHKSWLDTYIKLTDDKENIQFMSDKGMIEITNLPKMKFPDYTQLIPKDGTKIEFIASQLLEVVKAISIMARDGSGIIRLKFEHGEPIGKILVSAKSEEMGDSIVDCDAIVEADCRIAVNAKYLTELLSQCGDAKITLKITTPSSPMLFDIPDNRTEVIMPMFVQWGDEPEPKSEASEIPDEIDTEESDEPTPEELNETLSEPE